MMNALGQAEIVVRGKLLHAAKDVLAMTEDEFRYLTVVAEVASTKGLGRDAHGLAGSSRRF